MGLRLNRASNSYLCSREGDAIQEKARAGCRRCAPFRVIAALGYCRMVYERKSRSDPALIAQFTRHLGQYVSNFTILQLAKSVYNI